MSQNNRRTGGTYINEEGGNLDMFGRIRVSLPQTTFEYGSQYNKGPVIWGEILAGTGTATHDPTCSCVTLATSGAGSVKRQTLKYIRYRPGRSNLSDLTFNLKSKPASGAKRVGLFDDNNGVFLELNDTGLCIVQRTNVSGSIVDTKYYQDEWNMDKFDGGGLSGMNFDITKAQVMQITMGWLGVEGWMVSFAYQNQVFPAHMVDYARRWKQSRL